MPSEPTDTYSDRGRLSLDEFRQAAGTGVLSPGALVERASADQAWDSVVDVVVVGTGSAALAAACTATDAGASVLVLERAAIYGGTTRASGGSGWIPNNPYMQDNGIVDDRPSALAYMARVPGLHRPGRTLPARHNAPCKLGPTDDATLGLAPADFKLLETFYDKGAEIIRVLAKIGALDYTAPLLQWDGTLTVDYYSRYQENTAPSGRSVKTMLADGTPGTGSAMIGELKAYLDRAGVEIRYRHRVSAVFQDDTGRVVGVRAQLVTGDTVRIKASKGVIFGTGGITHNPQQRQQFLRGPVVGGCGVPTNTGDFFSISMALGADMTNTSNAWLNEQVFEQCDDFCGTNLDVFAQPGDSMLTINRFGERIVNEKHNYNERSKIHHLWLDGEFINYLTFMIWDARCAQEYSGWYPIPIRGAVAPHILSGDTPEQLISAIDSRLDHLWQTRKGTFHTGRVRMDDGAAVRLRHSIARFNQFAVTGRDLDFHRGEQPIERVMAGPPMPSNELPNPLMHPMSDSGPYYATILVGAAFETAGGPRIDSDARVRSVDGTSIQGLYAVGNCAASVLGQGYTGAGSTLGPGLVFGGLAGYAAGTDKGDGV